MALDARDKRISRRSWLLAGLAIPLFRARAAESLVVAFDGDNLRPSAPGLHFLTGKALDRLKDARHGGFSFAAHIVRGKTASRYFAGCRSGST